MFAGDPAGEEPVVGTADVGGLAAAGELFADELVEGFGQLDGEGVECDGEPSVGVFADLCGAHPADPCEGLCVEQQE
jgi:hypothetical protein